MQTFHGNQLSLVLETCSELIYHSTPSDTRHVRFFLTGWVHTPSSWVNGRAVSANKLMSDGAPLGEGLGAKTRLGRGFSKSALPKDS